MLSQKVQLGDQETRALHVLGYLFLRMGKFARAKRLFSALLALDPKNFYARSALAFACIKMKDGETALHVLLDVHPDSPLPGGEATLHLLLARSHLLLGNEQAARESFATFLQIKSKSLT